MKYKVGDKVRVRRDLIEGQLHGGAVFHAEMSPLLGDIVTISHVFSGVSRYHLSENPTEEYWTDEMLEDVEEDKIEDVKFEEWKWYKSNVGSETFYYIKVNHFNGSVVYGERICTSEPAPEVYIKDDYWDSAESINQALKIGPLTDLSEIQQYLPEGHPDKVNTLEQSRESLLEEAKRRYPVGTRFKSAFLGYDIYTVDKPLYFIWRKTDVVVNAENGPSVYSDGKWAEIVESPKVTEEIRPDLSVKLIPPIQSLLLRDGMYVVGVDPIDFESSKNKGESNSPTNESDFPIISTKRIINFSQLT